jgi:hypothetical protein
MSPRTLKLMSISQYLSSFYTGVTLLDWVVPLSLGISNSDGKEKRFANATAEFRCHTVVVIIMRYCHGEIIHVPEGLWNKASKDSRLWKQQCHFTQIPQQCRRHEPGHPPGPFGPKVPPPLVHDEVDGRQHGRVAICSQFYSLFLPSPTEARSRSPFSEQCQVTPPFPATKG